MIRYDSMNCNLTCYEPFLNKDKWPCNTCQWRLIQKTNQEHEKLYKEIINELNNKEV